MQRKKTYPLLILLLAAGLWFGADRTVFGEETGTPEIATDYIDDHVTVPALGADISQVQGLENTDTESEQVAQEKNAAVSLAGTSSGLPSSYDSRNYGYVTLPKMQTDNTCWAYSAVAAAETDLIVDQTLLNGVVAAAENTDLSESQLAYFFYHMPLDDMGNTAGDATTPLGDYREVGGNHIFTTFALANWYGIADEADVTDADWDSDSLQLADYADDVHMQKAYWINLATDVSNVKEMIRQYGSVAISMYYDEGRYYNKTTHAYYNNAYSSVNHAVQIIGWDDSYSRYNFSKTPSADGAWLAKNSYGESFGDGGYFWISYEDKALNKDTAKAFVFDFERADNYDYIYQYDGSAGAYMDTSANDTGYRVASGNSIANVFTVPADAETGYQKLRAVSFALYDVGVDYSVQIYRNPTDQKDPQSGTPLLSQPKTGKTTFVGYYTVSLDDELLLSAGDTFSVVVTLSKSESGNISYFVDKTYTNGNWISFTNATQSGQSFACQNGAWVDLAETGATARIKAFTEDYRVMVESLELSGSTETLWKGETTQLEAAILPENAGVRTVDWSSSDASVAAVDETGLVTAKKAGTAVITASAKDGSNLSAECRITVRQPVERIETESTEITCNLHESVTLPMTLYPKNADAEGVYFVSMDDAVAAVDASGKVTGMGAGTAQIQVYSSYDGELLMTYKVNVEAQTEERATQTTTADTPAMVVMDASEDPLKAADPPKTGDESGVGQWILALLAGGVFAVGAGRKLFHR